MLAPQPDVLCGVGGSVWECLEVCSLEQGVQGVLGVPLCITPGGCCSRSCCMSDALQGRPAAFSRIFFFFQMNKMGFHS